MISRIDAHWLTRAETQAVFAALAAAGHDARAVGGAVRNTLIGKAASDVDIATPARPEAVMAAASHARLAVIPTGLKHGTVTMLSGGIAHEVTTLRQDVETDGRHAVVAFTDDWAADASRRDFTVNALYCAADGTLHDPLGGLPDLEARRVRFIGDAAVRIREDYLRILRFFRFTAEYAAGAPDAIGLAACGALRHGLRTLSAERVRAELVKLLVAPRAAEITRVMFDHGYWPALLGAAPSPSLLERRIALDEAGEIQGDAMQRLAAFAVVMPEDAAQLATRLRLSNADAARLATMATLSPTIAASCDARAWRALLYRNGHAALNDAIALAAARGGADWSRARASLHAMQQPILPVRGQDLVARGVAAGPVIGATLRRLEDLWIASDFSLTREALLAQV